MIFQRKKSLKKRVWSKTEKKERQIYGFQKRKRGIKKKRYCFPRLISWVKVKKEKYLVFQRRKGVKKKRYCFPRLISWVKVR